VLTAVGRTLYFVADDGIHGPELWRSDGTSRGTRLVKELNPGAGDTGPGQLTDVAGTLFFTASDGTHGDLWRSDGSAAGTTLVKEFGQGLQQGPQYLTAVGRILYLGANGGLWRSDGTTSGTVLIKQFHGEAGCGSAVCWLTDVAGTLFFTANDGSHYGLWRSDGTEAGTTLVKEGVRAIERTPVGSILYFTTLDYSNSWLWRSDGTEAGTVPISSVGVSPEGDGPWPQLTYAGGPLYFVRNGPGWPLLRTDGTPTGEKLLRSNIIPRQLTAVGKTLYFEGYDQKHGNELLRSDGTARGTRLVTDIRRGERSANLSDLTAVGKTLFFSANDGRHGTELWRAGAKPCKKAKGKCKKG
jgi:ELWxxDGT repeat protein